MEIGLMSGNTYRVAAAYARAGVLLSLSGHYHAGRPVMACDGVRYYVAPTISEEPFRSAKVYISFSTMSVASPIERTKSPVFSRIGTLISAKP